MNNLGVSQKDGKFIVTKNGEPINPSQSEGQAIITEFSSKEDAEKYMTILKTLLGRKKNVKN